MLGRLLKPGALSVAASHTGHPIDKEHITTSEYPICRSLRDYPTCLAVRIHSKGTQSSLDLRRPSCVVEAQHSGRHILTPLGPQYMMTFGVSPPVLCHSGATEGGTVATRAKSPDQVKASSRVGGAGTDPAARAQHV